MSEQTRLSAIGRGIAASGAVTPHLRVEAGVHGRNAKVIFVDAAGKETDISPACFEVDVRVSVRDLTRLDLKAIGSVIASAEKLQTAVEIVRREFGGADEITALGDGARHFAPVPPDSK